MLGEESRAVVRLAPACEVVEPAVLGERAPVSARPACAASVRKRSACVASTVTSRSNASEPQFATRARWKSVWAGSRSSGLRGRAACAVRRAAHADVEPIEPCLVGRQHREPERERLDDQPQLVDLGQLLLGYRCDPRAALRVEDDEPFARKRPQRLPQGGCAQVPRLGKRLDEHALSRSELAGDDRVPEPILRPDRYGCAVGSSDGHLGLGGACVLLGIGRPERRPDCRESAHRSGHDETLRDTPDAGHD